MINLNDLFHLPPVDDLIGEIAADGPGLTIVAGFDPATLPGQTAMLPSGKAGLVRILMRQILSARPLSRAVMVSERKDSVHVPRNLSRLVDIVSRKSSESWEACIARAASRQPNLLVLDDLNEETSLASLEVAGKGMRVLASMDTALRGVDVARQLVLWGARQVQLNAIAWIVSIQRVETLCPTCKRLDSLDAERLAEYRHQYANFDAQGSYYVPATCTECNGTGRKGDVSLFDFFHATTPPPAFFDMPSVLTMGSYALSLAAHGLLSLDDAQRVDTDQLRTMQQLLQQSARAYSVSYSALQRKLLELETSNNVLQQRTEALISLEKLGSELISSVDLSHLGDSVCRYARTLCGAGRAILYVLRPDNTAEVLATGGWKDKVLGTRFSVETVFGNDIDIPVTSMEPTPFGEWPPGISPRDPDMEGARLYLGLRVPLVAQDKLVGLLIVHPTTKPHFNPGDTALLRTLANQAALAIQRAELVDDLRAKIVQLESAQAELVEKERLERELELARQVQESLLPRSFPQFPGYTFAARCVPAHQVGGDFYDVLQLDEHRFGVVIADVSDKGMPAALFMALTRSLLLAEAEREMSPRAVLTHVNRLLLTLAQSEMFVAVFYGVVDTRDRSLVYARAGHDRPLLLRDGAAIPLGGNGVVLGQLDGASLVLTEERLLLQPHDRLVLFTDGLSDVRNNQGQMYGHDQLTQLFLSTVDQSAAGSNPAIFGALNAFRGVAEQFDDMTILIVDVN